METMCYEGSGLQQEETLTAYCQVINYLLATYAIDDVIARPNQK